MASKRAALRTPTRKSAEGTPLAGRFSFLSQASALLVESGCMEAAAYFGAQALRVRPIAYVLLVC
jgi:hypothetical protein